MRTFSLRSNAPSSRSSAAFIPLIRSGSYRSPSSGERKRKAASGSSIPRPTSRSASTGKAEEEILSLESCSAASRTLALGKFSELAIHRMRNFREGTDYQLAPHCQKWAHQRVVGQFHDRTQKTNQPPRTRRITKVLAPGVAFV